MILLESGARRIDRRTPGILPRVHGPSEPRRSAHVSRAASGGTGRVWGGRCSAFDTIDLEARPWIEHSGWPITRQELDPYYARAYECCDIGRYGTAVDELLPPKNAEEHGAGA